MEYRKDSEKITLSYETHLILQNLGQKKFQHGT